ncbi:MAG: AMP-binding protein [Acidobacteria bacterium]|nr:AMP-binding protein [Acidobacteriota bacterium]MBV9068810.1 AMP-binding protein [Acidobacteriota bacterium]MBV9187330.1 AMP-binding protein [Acidobacteriota bacterium]
MLAAEPAAVQPAGRRRYGGVMIDFESTESHLLLNPRMPSAERARLETMVPNIDAHVFVATSGSTGDIKLVALSKQAILASANAVNERLNVTSRDVWAAVLPTFHVGGLGVYARCHLAGARALPMPWDPRAFAESEATIASLVPAQVQDLIGARLTPSPTLRAILVGGGIFNLERGEWPALPSYGMTECCSTIAIEDTLLEHIDARRESDGRLAFRGPSLLTGYAAEQGLIDPKIDGWFVSEDLGEVDGRTLRVIGRAGDFVKIGGESVDLKRLDRILYELAGNDAAIVAVVDERLGHVIHLATAIEPSFAGAFNERVHPFERIREIHRVESIPRSPLGKLLRAQLAEAVALPRK